MFAWCGLPAAAAGTKSPAMVLVHGGGGTAFEHWVRLWNDRGYAAIAMDHLIREFPTWRDHQVFLEGNSEGKPYTLVMSDNKVPVFL